MYNVPVSSVCFFEDLVAPISDRQSLCSSHDDNGDATLAIYVIISALLLITLRSKRPRILRLTVSPGSGM